MDDKNDQVRVVRVIMYHLDMVFAVNWVYYFMIIEISIQDLSHEQWANLSQKCIFLVIKKNVLLGNHNENFGSVALLWHNAKVLTLLKVKCKIH